MLDAHADSTLSLALHERRGSLIGLGSGPLDRMQLFGGRDGRAVLSGATQAAAGSLRAAGVRQVSDEGLPHGASSSSLDGDALLGAGPDVKQTAPVLLATRTAKTLRARRPRARHGRIPRSPPTMPPALPAQPVPRAGSAAPEGGRRRNRKAAASPTPPPRRASPRRRARRRRARCRGLTAPSQVMQPSPAQVDWAAQMAEQGLLTTGNGYSARPTSTTSGWSPTRRTPISR